MLKKSILLLLATCMLLCLTACSTENVNTDTEVASVDDTQVPVSNGEWDTMLLNCDNQYFVVKRTVETYNSLTYEVGVVDKDNNWICEPSSSNSLAECITNETGKVAITGRTTSVGSNNFYYLGNGVVVASLGVNVCTENGECVSVGENYSVTNSGLYCYFYNIERNKSFYHNANSISTVIDGYIIIESDDWTRITDTGENEIDFVALRGPYSEGLFLGTPDSNWHDAEYGFYDINGILCIDLSEYDLQDIETTKFLDGYCNISFKNPAGNIYYATIDKNGNFVREPSKDKTIFDKPIEQKNNYEPKLITKNTLTVAVNATFPPFMYVDNENIIGFEAELIECIASEMNLTINYRDIAFDDIISNIASNKADVGISLIVPTASRKESVDFSNAYFVDAKTKEQYAIAVGKNKNLLADINAAIKQLTDSGKIYELKQKYNISETIDW